MLFKIKEKQKHSVNKSHIAKNKSETINWLNVQKREFFILKTKTLPKLMISHYVAFSVSIFERKGEIRWVYTVFIWFFNCVATFGCSHKVILNHPMTLPLDSYAKFRKILNFPKLIIRKPFSLVYKNLAESS